MASLNSEAQRVQSPRPAASTTKKATAGPGGRDDVFVRGAEYYRDGR
ncbi:hypothetical protein [Arthrobacter sp. 179]